MKTKKTVTAALLAALVCVATMIKIPTPPNGYVNLGDCVVFLSGWLLSPLYGFFSAGIGSGLADIFSGYVVYAPATFAIKGIMALIVFFVRKSRVIGGVLAEVFMVLGYFIFEGFLYGFAPSAVNIIPNALQGVAGLILGIVLIKIFEKNNILK